MPLIDSITDWLISRSTAATLELGTNRLFFCDGKYQNGRFTIDGIRSSNSETGYVKSDDSSDSYDSLALRAGIEKLCTGKMPRQKHVSVIIPDSMFYMGAISVPAVAAKTGVKPLLQRELQKSAPRAYGEYSLRYETAERKGNKHNIQFCALANQTVEVLSLLCLRSNLVPISIQPAFVGLLRLLSLKPNESEHPGVFLHFDMEGATLGIYDKNGLRSLTQIEIGVNSLLEALKNGMNCNYSVAWQTLFTEPLLLEDPAAAEAQLEINSFRFVESILADFLQKIYGILLLFSSENQKNTGFTRIVLSGQGAMINNIDRLVAYNLGIPTHRISREFADTDIKFPVISGESLETIATVLGNIVLDPAKIDRYDRTMAA